MYQRLILGIVVLVTVSACGSVGGGAPTPTTIPDTLSFVDPWARPSVGGMDAMGDDEGAMGDEADGEGDSMGDMAAGSNSAVYMTIRNTGTGVDRLISAESDVAQAVELHISEIADGVMSMRQVEAIDVPAGGEAVLEPGGLHVMLISLNRELLPGDTVELQLTFENAGTRDVQATVREP